MKEAEVKEIEKSESRILEPTETQNSEYFPCARTSQFSTLFCRTICLSDRNVDAVGRAELACLSLDGFGCFTGFDRFRFADSGFLIAPFGGAAADRYNRQKILLVTQTAAMLTAFVLASLTLTGNIEVWHLFVIAVFRPRKRL